MPTKFLKDAHDVLTLLKRTHLLLVLFVNGTSIKDARWLAKTTPTQHISERIRNTLK